MSPVPDRALVSAPIRPSLNHQAGLIPSSKPSERLSGSHTRVCSSTAELYHRPENHAVEPRKLFSRRWALLSGKWSRNACSKTARSRMGLLANIAPTMAIFIILPDPHFFGDIIGWDVKAMDLCRASTSAQRVELLMTSKPPGSTCAAYFSNEGPLRTRAISGRLHDGRPNGIVAEDDRAVCRPAAHLRSIGGNPGDVKTAVHRRVSQQLPGKQAPPAHRTR